HVDGWELLAETLQHASTRDFCTGVARVAVDHLLVLHEDHLQALALPLQQLEPDLRLGHLCISCKRSRRTGAAAIRASTFSRVAPARTQSRTSFAGGSMPRTEAANGTRVEASASAPRRPGASASATTTTSRPLANSAQIRTPPVQDGRPI